jgi:hypothetical protein
LDFVVFKLQQVATSRSYSCGGVLGLILAKKTPLRVEPKPGLDPRIHCVKQRRKKTNNEKAFAFVTRGPFPPFLVFFVPSFFPCV